MAPPSLSLEFDEKLLPVIDIWDDWKLKIAPPSTAVFPENMLPLMNAVA